jgi:hypothetical protein
LPELVDLFGRVTCGDGGVGPVGGLQGPGEDDLSLGPYGSGNDGTARRVGDRLGRIPHGLDVVPMQVVDERRVIPFGVLRPDPGLAADGRAVRDGGSEECIHGVPTLGGERNMRRCGHGLPTADREVVPFLGPVGDTVVLNVEFLKAEWGEAAV